jgi:hypothetical protein
VTDPGPDPRPPMPDPAPPIPPGPEVPDPLPPPPDPAPFYHEALLKIYETAR